MQTNHKHCERVDKQFSRVLAQLVREQSAIRQRKLQMFGHQNRLKRLAFGIFPPRHDRNGFHGRHVCFFQLAKQFVFALCNRFVYLFKSAVFITYAHKSHDMPRYASRKVEKHVFRPLRQRKMPGKRKHFRIRYRCRNRQIFFLFRSVFARISLIFRR